MPLNPRLLQSTVDTFWDREILPTLSKYIEIPAVSLSFDPDWAANGHLEAARQLVLDWLQTHQITDWIIRDETLPGKTPFILIDVPSNSSLTVLIYGHLDKQPEMDGWREDLGPWQPLIEGERLYGRGGADDGYALFAAVSALTAIKSQSLQHPRIVILIEFSEESGSPDLPDYLEKYSDIIGVPELVIALDSGVGDYYRLWSTTSLRGIVSCVLDVRVLHESAHSGIASGIVPSSMRIMRQLLDRVEDPSTGKCRLPEIEADIPTQRREQAKSAGEILGLETIIRSFSVVQGLNPTTCDPTELLLNNTWQPTLCVVGQDGIPALNSAGNVLRAHTAFKLSFRLPPSVDHRVAQEAIHRELTRDPPYGAEVSLRFMEGGTGWDAPPLAPWLEHATNDVSKLFYGEDAAYIGLGGSIPFMGMLGKRYPKAQFLITGVLGPNSNAHGPNEFLHISYAKKLTAAVAYLIVQYAELQGI
jgi:acetylornithine deacetylase/succinyl-diaminopimelate desuccinylase-like protein